MLSCRDKAIVFVCALSLACDRDESPERKAAESKPPAPEGEALGDEARSLIFDSPIRTLQGEETSLAAYEGEALLVVNVASECGYTPQYDGLQSLYEKYSGQGFSVLGFPCNQFGGQEPGSAEEIQEFCEVNFGVTFPLFEKIDVNGDDRHPIYEGLAGHADADGDAGDVAWNFEKFLISADRERVYRFRSATEPEAPELIAAIEAALP